MSNIQPSGAGGSSPPPEVTLNFDGLGVGNSGSSISLDIFASNLVALAKYTATGALVGVGSGNFTVSLSNAAPKVDVSGLYISASSNYGSWSMSFPNASGADLVVNTNWGAGVNANDTQLSQEQKLAFLANSNQSGCNGRTLSMTAGYAFTDAVSSTVSEGGSGPTGDWSPAGWYGGKRLFTNGNWVLWWDYNGGRWQISSQPGNVPSAEEGSTCNGWSGEQQAAASGAYAFVYSSNEPADSGTVTVTRAGSLQGDAEGYVGSLVGRGWTVSLNTNISGGGQS
jgi:hypothetical protein